ncbi:hypothetical protein ABE65_016265 [Fictibacillus phosphorivorans]|jgi:hypothetical protein|uniref:DUF2971 domain-containing protein n=1 Tax=Fictibacillus phosphorivorans TaxID=1221500 RepID=A0A160IQ80_9BACL|nr:hypothetical protein [Fictibacillus phosphorivorans]ANC78270.1 hypothetical protein ABE65_016265 [Fictibacillus phosphorivorans]
MGITIKEWGKRVASRTDLTGRLTHLTKPSGVDFSCLSFEDINLRAVDNLIKILKEGKIIGSQTKPGFIIGKQKAVCFQDAPLYALIQNVEHERQRRERNNYEKLRYCGVGLSFVKPYIYHYYGGRPVIYEESKTAKAFLPSEEWWRIVDIEYKIDNDWDIVDWTHEREWRIPGDMIINEGYPHIIVYNPTCAQYFLNHCPKEILNKTYGITTLTSLLH